MPERTAKPEVGQLPVEREEGVFCETFIWLGAEDQETPKISTKQSGFWQFDSQIRP
jgi:hypothetical protein